MNEKELIKACEDGDLKKVESLVEKGFDINAKNNYGWTALMWASTIGISNIDIVKYLVKEGADINAKNNYSWTALMFASMVGSFDIVKHLIYKGSDINIKNNDGDTALILASMDCHLDIVEYLIENEADVKPKNSCGWTALMYILKNKQSEENNQPIENGKSEELINFFLENGGSVDLKKYHTKDKDKILPLCKFIAGTINDIIRNDGGNLKKIKDLVDNGKNDDLNTFLSKKQPTDL